MAQITVKTGMDTRPVIQSIAQMNSSIASMRRTISSVGKDMDASVAGYAKAMKTSATVSQEVNARVRDLKETYELLLSRLDKLANTKIDTEQYAKLKKEISGVEKQIGKLEAAQQKLKSLGKDIVPTKEFTALQKQIDSAIKKYDDLERKYTEISNKASETGGIRTDIGKEINSTKRIINSLIDQRNAAQESGKIIDVTKFEAQIEKQRRALALLQADYKETEKQEDSYWNSLRKIEEQSLHASEALKELEATREKMIETGMDTTTSESMKKYQVEIEEATKQLRELQEQQEAMKNSGIATISGDQTREYGDLIRKAEEAEEKMRAAINEANQRTEPPHLEQWRNMATVSGTVAEGFARIVNAAQIAATAIQHPFQALDRIIPVVVSGIANLVGHLKDLAVSFGKKAISSFVSGLKSLATNALQAASGLAKMVASGAINFLKKLGDGARNVADNARNAALQLAKMAGNAVATGVKKIGSTVGNLAKSLFGLGNSARSSGMSFNQGLKMIIRYGLGVRSMYALVNKIRSAMVAAFQNMAQQVPSVNATISGLVSSLAQLKASLATAFQPIVTAVAPYLNQLMAMLSQAMTKIGEFFAALTGQKFVYKANKPNIDYAKANQTEAQKAAQKQQQKELKAQQAEAKKQQQQELARQKAEVKAQNDAEKARVKAEKDALKAEKGRRKEMEKTTKEADRQLASFDELDILEDNSKDDTGTDTSDLDDAIADLKANLEDMPTTADIMSNLPSGAEIADYVTPDVTYEKIPVEEEIANFAKRIKDALSKGNLYDIGKGLAEKLNNWISGIKWAELGKKVGKGINSIVSLLNGFFDNFKWRQLGKDFAKFVNSILGTVDFYELGRLMTQKIAAITKVLNGFFHDLDWESLGRAIADFADGLMTIPWDTLGDTIGTAITGIFTALYTAATRFDWKSAGEKIASGVDKMFDAIDWVIISDALIALMNGALDAMIAFVDTFPWAQHGKEFAKGVMTFINEFPAEKAAKALTGFIKGVLDFILPTISDPSFWTGIGSKFAEFVNGVFTDKEMWDKVEKTVESLINGVFKSLKELVSGFEFGEAGQIFADEFNKLVTNINEQDIYDALSGLIKGILDFITPTLSDTATWVTISAKFAALVHDVFDDKELWQKMKTAVIAGVKAVITVIKTFFGSFEWGTEGTKFKNKILELQNEFPKDELSEAFREALKGALEFMLGVFGDGQIIGRFATDAASFFNDVFADDQLMTDVGKAAYGMLNSILTFGENFLKEFDPKQAAEGIKTALAEIPWDDVTSRAWELLKTAAGDIMEFVCALFGVDSGQSVGTIAEQIGGKIGEILNGIDWPSIFNAIKDTVLGLGKGLIDELLGGNGKVLVWVVAGFAALKLGILPLIAKLIAGIGGALISSGPLLEATIIAICTGIIVKGTETLVNGLKEMHDNAKATLEANQSETAYVMKGYIKVFQDSGAEVANEWAKSTFNITLEGNNLRDNLAEIGQQIATQQGNTMSTINSDAQMAMAAYKQLFETTSADNANNWAQSNLGIQMSSKNLSENLAQIEESITRMTYDNTINVSNMVSTACSNVLTEGTAASEGLETSVSTAATNIETATAEAGAAAKDNLVNPLSEAALSEQEILGTITQGYDDATVSINESAQNITYVDTLTEQLSNAALTTDEKFALMQSAVDTALYDMNTSTSMSTEEIKLSYEGLSTALETASAELWPSLSEEQRTALTTMQTELATKAQDMSATAKEHGTEVKESISTAYGDTASKVKESTGEMKTAVTTDMGDMSTAVKESSESVKGDLPSAYDEAGKGVTDAVSTMESNVDSKMGDIKSDISSGNNSVEKQTEPYFYIWNTIIDIVETAMDILRSTVDSGMGNIASTVKNRARDVESAFKSLNWSDVGSDIVRGIESGLNGSWPALESAVRQKAQQLLQAAKNSLGIHSPSRLFRDEVGQMVGEGLALGIDDSQANVLSSVADMATSMVNEMQDTDLTADLNADGDTMLNGLSNVLSTFSLNVENSFLNLIDRLQAIAESVTYQEPAVAGSVLPYAVQGTANVDTQDMSVAMNQSNEELISVLMQLVNNQTSALLRGMEQYCTTNVNLDKKSLTDAVIEEINRRTRAMGASPLVI